jgi:hypothetical protein
MLGDDATRAKQESVGKVGEAGYRAGGEWAEAAILASLTATCRRHEIDPQLYLTQLLVNLPSWPARDLDAWLPDQWKLRQAARLATLQDMAIADS